MVAIPVKDLNRPVCVGDRAIVRGDLSNLKDYKMVTGYVIGVAEDMLRFRNMEITISSIRNRGCGYRIIEDGARWVWTDEMFEGIIVADEDFGEIDTSGDVSLEFLFGGT